MSESIIIRKDGTEWTGNVDGVRIKESGGGSGEWAPQAEGNLVRLKIGENGTYKASDYDAYGISVAEVTQSALKAKAVADGNVKAVKSTAVISEGGTPRIMTAKKIRVNKVGGGTVDMVPEGAYSLTTLYVTKQGIYNAKTEDCAGYSQVVVNISESQGGGDGGWTDLPDEIRVTTMPDKTAYAGAESIDYTGIVVTAFRNNKVWAVAEYPGGIIPFDELELPAVTIGDESLKLGLINSVSEDDFQGDSFGPLYYQWFQDNLPLWFKLNGTSYYMRGDIDYHEPVVLVQCSEHEAVAPFYVIGGNGMIFILASNKPFTYKADTSASEERYTHSPVRTFSASAFTNSGKTVYWGGITINQGFFKGSNCVDAINYLSHTPSLPLNQYIAWFMLYGGTQLSIPVKWARPRDYKVLETSFNVNAPIYAETHGV